MRLTKKNNGMGSWTQFGDKYIPAHNIKHKQCVIKLGQLEDIEEELGIDLITLFKVLRNGVYYKYKYGYEYRISKCRKCYLSNKMTLVVDYHTYKYLNDYGKTWALTKEELL